MLGVRAMFMPTGPHPQVVQHTLWSSKSSATCRILPPGPVPMQHQRARAALASLIGSQCAHQHSNADGQHTPATDSMRKNLQHYRWGMVSYRLVSWYYGGNATGARKAIGRRRCTKLCLSRNITASSVLANASQFQFASHNAADDLRETIQFWSEDGQPTRGRRATALPDSSRLRGALNAAVRSKEERNSSIAEA